MDYVKIDAVCKELQCSKSLIHKMTRENTIPHYKLNSRNIYYSLREIYAFMKSKRVSTAEQESARILTLRKISKSRV